MELEKLIDESNYELILKDYGKKELNGVLKHLESKGKFEECSKIRDLINNVN